MNRIFKFSKQATRLPYQFQVRNMATPSKILLSTIEAPEYWTKPDPSSAQKASELIQKNHDNYHIFFNNSGFHNHIAHHLLTVYALGANPSIIQRAYDDNDSYQRDITFGKPGPVTDLTDPKAYKDALGKPKYYRDFLVYFAQEMEKKGWENVVLEYVFKGDERANDLLGRIFAGLLHPFIHFGFGVEFQQPAIIAEALAQAAIHGDYLSPLWFEIEKAGKEYKGSKKTMVQIIEDIHNDKQVSAAAYHGDEQANSPVRYEDENKIRDGLMVRAREQIINHVIQYSVSEEDMKRQLAEVLNATIYFCTACQRPDKAIKFDFNLMHHINSSVFLSRFMKLPWLPMESKIRLLEWKARIDLVQYASRGSPALHIEEITNYKSKQPSDWPELFDRANNFPDDGHTAKFIRALAHAERVCADWQDGRDEFKIKDDMWKRLGNMVIDSVEEGEPHWVRNVGWDEAWEHLPPRGEYKIRL